MALLAKVDRPVTKRVPHQIDTYCIDAGSDPNGTCSAFFKSPFDESLFSIEDHFQTTTCHSRIENPSTQNCRIVLNPFERFSFNTTPEISNSIQQK